jgi:Domain of unknown function (DUF5655)
MSAPDLDEELASFFSGRPDAFQLFEVIRALDIMDQVELRVSKSQVAFRRGRDFAWVWTPDRWLRGKTAPRLVLSVALPRRDNSTRWKQVVEPRPGQWMHHLEIWSATDIDGEVQSRLREAAESAEPGGRPSG